MAFFQIKMFRERFARLAENAQQSSGVNESVSVPIMPEQENSLSSAVIQRRNHSRLSFASLRQIFILSIKSFLLKDSLASI